MTVNVGDYVLLTPSDGYSRPVLSITDGVAILADNDEEDGTAVIIVPVSDLRVIFNAAEAARLSEAPTTFRSEDFIEVERPESEG